MLEGVEPDGRLRLLEPELGPMLVPATALLPPDAERLTLLLARRRPGSKERRFSWGWYGPYLAPHRDELIQVLACTAVTTVLGIVIGLGTMRMITAQAGGTDAIDGVISIGIILVVACVMEAVVSALRSLIFTGVANRVDMDTRETILDRLVRLPQGFFDERPVGRIVYYFRQLDQLREFLISKALTSILDFGFSFLFLEALVQLEGQVTIADSDHRVADLIEIKLGLQKAQVQLVAENLLLETLQALSFSGEVGEIFLAPTLGFEILIQLILVLNPQPRYVGPHCSDFMVFCELYGLANFVVDRGLGNGQAEALLASQPIQLFRRGPGDPRHEFDPAIAIGCGGRRHQA